MLERSSLDSGVRMTEAPEPVIVITEKIGIDRSDPNSAALGVRREVAPVVDSIPGNVNRNGRTAAGQLVNERGVCDPLVDIASSPGPRINVEARSGVAVAPRRRLDFESS